MLVTADKVKAVSTLAERWWEWDWLGPVASLVGGGWLAFRLRGWGRLQEELVGRYGLPAGE